MGNSPLVNYTKISPNKTKLCNRKIDTITIHCVVGQCSIETLGNIFARESRRASSNYGIGPDGRIGMYVEEKDASWCSSNSANDRRAITIECASDTTHPYAINDKVYSSLVDLCADICIRNNIKELKWKADKTLIGQTDKQNLTVHRWFANKSCPGDYIYERLGQITKDVNTKIRQPFKVRVDIDDLNYRSKPSVKGIIKGQTGKGVFTIVEVSNGWGRLKSDAGWINLSYTTKV